jgi:hypothetical protein
VASDQPIKGKCGSPLRKKPGKFCTEWPMRGRTRCKLHGGASPVGIASARATHLRYSKYLPVGLLEKFVEAMGDEKLLRLDENVGAVEMQIMAMLDELAKGGVDWESAWKLWADTRRQWTEFHGALIAKDNKRFNELLPEMESAFLPGAPLDAVFSAGSADHACHERLRKLHETKAKLVEAISRHETREKEVLTVQSAVGLFTAIGALIKQNVQDREALKNIARGLDRLMQGPEGSRLPALPESAQFKM